MSSFAPWKGRALTREYFDLPSGREEPPRRASRGLQDRFSMLASAFMAELCANMEGIADEFPTVGKARADLKAFMDTHPGTTFRRFRPEVLQESVESGDKICPR